MDLRSRYIGSQSLPVHVRTIIDYQIDSGRVSQERNRLISGKKNVYTYIFDASTMSEPCNRNTGSRSVRLKKIFFFSPLDAEARVAV